MKATLPLIATTIALAGCALNVTLMPRDSGKTFSGEMKSNGTGAGTMTVRLDGDTCTGPAARVASGESFGFVHTYGRDNKGGRATGIGMAVTEGDTAVKAIMSCVSGKGLRCDITGRDGNGGGICLDDSGRVYDALVVRK